MNQANHTEAVKDWLKKKELWEHQGLNLLTF